MGSHEFDCTYVRAVSAPPGTAGRCWHAEGKARHRLPAAALAIAGRHSCEGRHPWVATRRWSGRLKEAEAVAVDCTSSR